MALQTELFPKGEAPQGIPIPAFKHRWLMATAFSEEIDQWLRTNVVEAKFDFARQHAIIKIQQPLFVPGLMANIGKLSFSPITFCHLTGSATMGSYFVISGKLDSHKYDLDYSSSEFCTHELTFTEVQIINEGAGDPNVELDI